MSAETTLYATLTASTGVSALVASRVYPDVAPQDVTLPSVVFERTDTEYVNTIHGTAVAQRATLEVWCMAEGRSDAEQLADAVIAAVRPASFLTTGRRAEFNAEQSVWAAVVTLDFWE